MTVADNLRKISEVAWAPMERMIEDAEELVEIRNAAKEQGLDWGPIKALLKARIQDERDGGERVKKLVMKADTASEYAEMLNFMAEKQKTPPQSSNPKPAASQTAVIPDSGEPALPASASPEHPAGSAGSLSLDPNDEDDIRNQHFYRGPKVVA